MTRHLNFRVGKPARLYKGPAWASSHYLAGYAALLKAILRRKELDMEQEITSVERKKKKKVSEWLLSDKQIDEAIWAIDRRRSLKRWWSGDPELRAIAQAQLRKVIEVISRRQDECMADLGLLFAHGVRKLDLVPISGKAWEELKGEAGLGGQEEVK